MSGRGEIHIVKRVPVIGTTFEKSGHQYEVVEVFARRGGIYRCRTKSKDRHRIEVWFTVQVEGAL